MFYNFTRHFPLFDWGPPLTNSNKEINQRLRPSSRTTVPQGNLGASFTKSTFQSSNDDVPTHSTTRLAPVAAEKQAPNDHCPIKSPSITINMGDALKEVPVPLL